MLTHAANFYLARNCVELMAYGETDIVFNAFPLFHVNARYSGLLPVMYADGESVLYSRFSASGSGTPAASRASPRSTTWARC